MKHELWELQQMQSMSLDSKIAMTVTRIKGWLKTFDDQCYISFSGGKDSTVLVDIIHNKMGRKDIPLVFIDTGLEYPEIREFVRSYGDKVTWLKPKMNFRQVIEKYGYPFISKEVSESVSGARKYLTSLIKDGTLDRQTDRQAVPLFVRQSYWNRSISEICEKEHTIRTNTKSLTYWERLDNRAVTNPSRGGYDNKYRKLRGIGEYSKRTNEKQVRWQQSETSDNVRYVDKGQGRTDKGEYP